MNGHREAHGMPRFAIDHFQITVPKAAEAACCAFYRDVLGLREIEKPAELRARGGAWFESSGVQLHVSVEDVPRAENERSRRHVCLRTDDLAAAEDVLRSAGFEILADKQPTRDWRRFYVRDPGGWRVEIAQRAEG